MQTKKLRLEKVLLKKTKKLGIIQYINMSIITNRIWITTGNIATVKLKYNKFTKTKANRIKIRSKWEWYKRREKSSKFFLNDCNGTRTHNNLIRKLTINRLASLASLDKWLHFCLQTKWLWVLSPVAVT